MPIYEYKCACGWTGTFIKSVHHRAHICPECKEPLRPIPSSGVQRRWANDSRPD